MRRLEWLLQIWFMWHVIKIIKTQSEMHTKENIFSVLRHPAVNGDGNRDIIKYSPKICYDDNHDDNEETTDSLKPATEEEHAFELLNMFKNIVQQIQKSNCRKTKSFLITAPTTTMPQTETVAASETSQRAYQKYVQQPQQEVGETRAGLKAFSILEQLKLDEMEELHEKHQNLQKQQQQQQQQKLLQMQQMQNMQHILETLKAQNLAKATKKKKKKKKRVKKPTKNKKRKKKQKPVNHASPLVAQPAHILFASAIPRPIITTTPKPQKHKVEPVKKIKYILRKNSIFKKKKKEYLNHLKHVFYPFIKFIAFFTILNPFTLAVFLFSLISPVVFGFIGFVALSFLIKPALHLLFGVKRTVNSINRKKWLQHQRSEHLRHSRRPITIHKHYYQQRPIAAPPPKSKPSHRYPHHNHRQHSKHFNPILPHVRYKLAMDSFEKFEENL